MHARSEILSSMIYAIFSINVPEVCVETMKEPGSKKERLAFISKWDDDLEHICHKNVDCTKRMKDIKKQLAKIHLISALVKNDDANLNNVLSKEDNVFVIDAGRGFEFGSNFGKLRPSKREYNQKADEFCSLVDPRVEHNKMFKCPFKKYTMKNTDNLIVWLDSCWDEGKINALIKKSKIEKGEMIFINLKLRFDDIKTQLQELNKDNTLCQRK